ncbi:histidine ammonia-lyase [Caldisphaera lagunensis DSM 15908]|uniref:Histidine ammonia-lyase n=1 Tax=Caldisphaera lagunensis (strain DSM 15908 / JCM 11604 / ANMR 0165 / IC-154) TaxID=1056495 RepID=L0A7M0_CALLD|nr:aromatic amino acid ammonia-lyase [Caldisphaera lagunensis]AFZ69868.1 histidine ammonia-lyase [Caldisphaera lagunensis DSM 15908]
MLCKNEISLDDFFKILFSNEKISICEERLNKIKRSREVYETEGKKGKVYGYSTSLGALLNKENAYTEEREKIILKEHDTGIGKNVPYLLVKAAMLVRLIQLSNGNSPIRQEVVNRLIDAINYDIIPTVSILGSVGASGDLAPLARIFRCIIYGEGSAYYKGKVVNCVDALKEKGLNVMNLIPGEALALINSNAFSTAFSIINAYITERLAYASLDIAKKSLKITGCNNEHFSDAVYETKKQMGVKKVIDMLNNSCEETPRLQDPYSIRCLPQIYGALFDTLEFSKSILKNEMNSSSDNPIIYENKVYHACQFHAIYSALISDFLKIAIIPVMNSIERRISQILDGKINRVNDFLLKENSVVGAMIMQYTSAALNAYSRGSSISMSSHSVPTSGTQEDIVSMAPNSSIELLKMNSLFLKIIAVELALYKYYNSKDLPDPRILLEESFSEIINNYNLKNFSEFLNYFF